jgi:hypothetical protein
MTTRDRLDNASLLRAAASVPEHVVSQTFPDEMVLLNLRTGKYHGLNKVGMAMLQALDQADTVGQAATRLSTEYRRPIEEVERKLCDFCIGLVERGLIEMDDPRA